VRGCDSDAVVPACPGWRVREVVAHLAGLCEDWVEGRLQGYGSSQWTAAQVDRYSAATIEEILTDLARGCSAVRRSQRSSGDGSARTLGVR
jgi:hypothetical protein